MASGMWNWEATAPLSRMKRFSPTRASTGQGSNRWRGGRLRRLRGLWRDSGRREHRRGILAPGRFRRGRRWPARSPMPLMVPDPGGSGADGGDGAGSGHAEVVVTVEVDGNLRPTHSRTWRTRNSTASGPQAPMVSTTTISAAPASMAVS